MPVSKYFNGNIVIIRLFWIFFIINIAAVLILADQNGSILVTIHLIEIATLLLVNILMRRYKRSSLREEASLRSVLGQLNIVSWSYEPRKKRFFISSGIEQITGYSAVDFTRKPDLFGKIVHPYDIFCYRESHKDLISGKKTIIEYRILKPSGEIRWISNMAVPLQDESGNVYKVEGIILDVTREKIFQEDMTRMALYDSLTGLPNRAMFEKYFSYFMARNSHMQQKMAIIFIDLDSFKSVNDRLGHDMGDLVLQEVTERLKTIFRGTDLLSRLGGDEFIALLTRINKDSLKIISERIIATLARPFIIEGHEIIIGASIGISVSPDDGEDLETLVHKADKAMYRAKAKGKNTYQIYNGKYQG